MLDKLILCWLLLLLLLCWGRRLARWKLWRAIARRKIKCVKDERREWDQASSCWVPAAKKGSARRIKNKYNFSRDFGEQKSQWQSSIGIISHSTSLMLLGFTGKWSSFPSCLPFCGSFGWKLFGNNFSFTFVLNVFIRYFKLQELSQGCLVKTRGHVIGGGLRYCCNQWRSRHRWRWWKYCQPIRARRQKGSVALNNLPNQDNFTINDYFTFHTDIKII